MSKKHTKKDESTENAQHSNTHNADVMCDRSSTIIKGVENDCEVEKTILGQYITKEYELLRLVLSYLPFRDLCAAAKVCKAWRSTAEVVQRTRHGTHTFFWFAGNFSKQEMPYKMFSKYFYNNPQCCLIFMTFQFDSDESKCLSGVPCPLSKGEPCLVLHRVVHYIRAELEPECQCAMIEVSFGLSCSTYDLSDVVGGYEGYAGILLPKVPGCTVTVFMLTKVDYEKLQNMQEKDCLSNEEIYQMTQIFPSALQPVRCLLLFCRGSFFMRSYRAIQNFIRSLTMRQGVDFALGGAFVRNFEIPSVTSKYPYPEHGILGIAFIGQNIQATSTVLNSDDLSNEGYVNEAVHEIRSNHVVSKESRGFLFACSDPCYYAYEERTLLRKSFQVHFPLTTLVSCFSYADQIGCKYSAVGEQTETDPSSKCLQRRKERINRQNLFHLNSSVVVYVSCKKQ